ncbi:MAG: hypothetical protein JWN86_1293 [Planctomycetota bacterium]|nr:hypothetical protein [Planctomycetota bacterium]
MTGFGESRHVDDRLSVQVEVRTVNNRHLKLNAKISDPFSSLEPDFERLIRETIRRGTVQMSLRVERPRREDDYRLNTTALKSYWHQIRTTLGDDWTLGVAGILALPGVVDARKVSDEDPREEWPLLSRLVSEALTKLQASRAEEGKAMACELLTLGASLSERLTQIEARGPTVVSSYMARLQERVQSLVAGQGVTIEPKDLIREIAILSERADIAEEVVRLRAHFRQFVEVIGEPESAGRKLEFVVQEMGRETNTIGSKANDVEISRSVVELKGTLEKIRELIQNVE